MTHVDRKRQTGYFDLLLTQYCGNCRNCVRKGTHLRCDKYGYGVSAYGICRAGWTELDLPLNAQEHPLLVQEAPAEPPVACDDPDGKVVGHGQT